MECPDSRSAAAWDALAAKQAAGRRLSADDGLRLFDPQVDLHRIGQWAHAVRTARHGRVAWYNINAHLNPTNVCLYRCPLCAYSCDRGDARAFVLRDEEILARGQEAVDHGCTEVHIVGGVHPDQPFAWYRGIVRQLHAAYPRLHLKAWTAVEIAWFAQQSQRSVDWVLGELIEAGLGSLPGGGAEIFAPDARRQVAPTKADGDTWLAVHRAAHRLGLRTNASMLFGHVESAHDRVDHLLRLRQLQDETGGFQTFIPLAFHPANTRLSHLHRPSGLLDLRVLAVSRLLLDNIDHIKAYWISLGVGTAQVALAYGADDLDGTVRHEAIHHEAGAQSPQVLSVDELRGLIAEAGCQPQERDSLYRPIERSGAQWEVAAGR